MDIYSSNKKARHAASDKKDKKPRKPLTKKQKKLLIILISVLGALTVILGSFTGFLIWMTSDYNYNSEVSEDEEIQQIVPIDKSIVNIALFGIDTRNTESFKGLSDSIMILSLNKGTGDIKLISVMRDSLVEIPKDSGIKYNKINSAYSAGGAPLAIKTLNRNFGLDIKEYATVNFYGMADIVDAVGGVEIEVQEKEIDAKNGLNRNIIEQAEYLGIKNVEEYLVKKEGKQTLSGIQAVAWARIRSVSTSEGTADDYGRTDRQRVVIEQLLGKALSMKVTEYPSLIKKILPYLETSLSYGEILDLSGMLSKKIAFTQTRVPQNDYVIPAPKISGVGSVVYYNLDFTKDIIHSYIYDGINQEEYLKNNKIIKEGWYTGPTASTNTSSKSNNSSSNNTNSSKNQTGSSKVSSTVSSSDASTSSVIVSSTVSSSSNVSSSAVSSSSITQTGDGVSSAASSSKASSTTVTPSETVDTQTQPAA